jgi:hypothetical protein
MNLVEECNNRRIRTRFIVDKNKKYNNPRKYERRLIEIADEHNIQLVNKEDYKFEDGVYFTVEGVSSKEIPKSSKVLSLTAMTDFRSLYDNYIDHVDHVIMSSEFMASYYGKITDKNLYLGTPKYDVELNKSDMLKKYGLTDGRYALVVFPRLRDLGSANINQIYDVLEGSGYSILVKTRGKDRVAESFKRGRYYEDGEWHPHPTSELMALSDIVVNFDSTAIEEAVMSRSPILNFRIKTNMERGFSFLYDYDYCIDLPSDFSKWDIHDSIIKLPERKLDDVFDLAIKNHLFNSGSVSAAILDFIDV